MTPLKTIAKLMTYLAIFVNCYVILMGFALMASHPESTITASIICDVLNVIFFYILLKTKYDRHTYKATKKSDRFLIRSMAITAALFPCALMKAATVYFALAVFIFSTFIPTRKNIDSILKCDYYSLVRKEKEDRNEKK